MKFIVLLLLFSRSLSTIRSLFTWSVFGVCKHVNCEEQYIWNILCNDISTSTGIEPTTFASTVKCLNIYHISMLCNSNIISTRIQAGIGIVLGSISGKTLQSFPMYCSRAMWTHYHCYFPILIVLAVVTCSIPAFPANLTTDNTQCGTEMRRNYNTSCMYECQPGYDLIGNSSVMCQASGALSADLPTCEGMSIWQLLLENSHE